MLNQDLRGLPTPFYLGGTDNGIAPKALLELRLIRLSNAIRNKPEWQRKVFREDIVSRWRSELKGSGGPESTTESAASDQELDYVLAELRHDATHEPYRFGINAVRVANNVVPLSVHADLCDEAQALENVPESQRDWHPGSNLQVLDLVHPSLYCFVYGVTKGIRPEPVKEWVATQCVIGKDPLPILGNFQWLPSEFHVASDGSVTIGSYINNLHPHTHGGLYRTIARLFQCCVPLFNGVLSELKYPRPNLIKVDPNKWYGEEPDFSTHRDRDTNDERDTDEEFGTDEGPDSDEERERWYATRQPILPTVPSEFRPWTPRRTVDLRDRRLQVIVKLANIHLTPERPEYPGGAWHVEGTQHEHIVATAIYYYSMENVTESRLAFRAAVHEPDYEQNDERGVRAVYGLEHGGQLNQNLGAIVAAQGRAIAFPNIYQHRVEPFALQDRRRPGHRKIVVFFLVDPAKRVVSTAHVPPQQIPWTTRALRDLRVPQFARLPPNVLAMIARAAGAMTLYDAKRYRERLMHERKYLVNENTHEIFEREFSLCEH